MAVSFISFFTLAVLCLGTSASSDAHVELRHGVTDHDGLVYLRPSQYKHSVDVEAHNDLMPVLFHDFDSKDAEVICRELGFVGGVSACCGDWDGDGQLTTIEAATVSSSCTGTERSFRDCAQVTSFELNWDEDPKYAAVSCFTNTSSEEDYHLSLDFNEIYYNYELDDLADYYDAEKLHNESWGLVKVMYNGLPGHICGDGWTDQAAGVACRELGFPNGQKYLHVNYFSHHPIVWSSNFNCTGAEKRLSECRHDGWGHTKQCNDKDAFAGVLCYRDEGVKYRLYNPDPQVTWGRVEVMLPHTNTWATLCDEHFHKWSNTEAHVACRMFGYKTGEMWKGPSLPPSSGPRYERKEYCQGNESHLEDCVHEGFVPAYSLACQRPESEAIVFCMPYPPGEHPHKKITTTTAATTTTPEPTTTPTTTITPKPTTTPTTTTTTPKPTTTTTPKPTKTTTTTPKPSTTTTTTTTSPTTRKTTATTRQTTRIAKPTTTPQAAPGLTSRPSGHQTSSTSPPGLDTQAGDQTTHPSSSSSSAGDYAGEITGGVLALLAVCGSVVAGFFFWRRYRQRKAVRSTEGGIVNVAYDVQLDKIQLQPAV